MSLALSSATAVLARALPYRRGPAAAELPRRVKILDWGVNTGRTTGARVLVDERVVETLCANQETTACERIPLDYEHQSVPAHPNYLPDPRDVPAHGEIEVVSGDGVYLSSLDYTPSGLAHAASYQDVSAVVHLDPDGRPLWISSVALTQRGDVAGMEFAESLAALAASAIPNPKSAIRNSPPPTTMPDTQSTDAPAWRDLLIATLGLTPGEVLLALSARTPEIPAARTDALSADEARAAKSLGLTDDEYRLALA
jgi:phage I-like protein